MECWGLLQLVILGFIFVAILALPFELARHWRHLEERSDSVHDSISARISREDGSYSREGAAGSFLQKAFKENRIEKDSEFQKKYELELLKEQQKSAWSRTRGGDD
jgi:hypothetical protein